MACQIHKHQDNRLDSNSSLGKENRSLIVNRKKTIRFDHLLWPIIFLSWSISKSLFLLLFVLWRKKQFCFIHADRQMIEKENEISFINFSQSDILFWRDREAHLWEYLNSFSDRELSSGKDFPSFPGQCSDEEYSEICIHRSSSANDRTRIGKAEHHKWSMFV